MSNPDIRWQQRLANYQKALAQLHKFIAKGDLNELEIQGLIQCFEYTHELAWNVMKDYLNEQGVQNIFGSKNACKAAFSVGLIDNSTYWAAMITDRNRSVHTYNEQTANEIANNIVCHYYALFIAFEQKMSTLIL